jgi:hypothetical protein
VFDGHPRVVCRRPDANRKNARGLRLAAACDSGLTVRNSEAPANLISRRRPASRSSARSDIFVPPRYTQRRPASARSRQTGSERRDLAAGTYSGSLFGPLDQANGIVTEVLAKPCIQELFWKVETIEIKVIPVYPRNHINFNQCVGRAFDRPGMAACAQQRTHEGGFPGAEVAVEPDDHARRQQPGARWRPSLAVAASSGRCRVSEDWL